MELMLAFAGGFVAFPIVVALLLFGVTIYCDARGGANVCSLGYWMGYDGR
jgi:hypothetical protein